MPDEQALIVLTCRCGQKMKAPAKAKGKVFKCVRCGALLRTQETHADVPPPVVVNGDPPRVAEAMEPIGQLLEKARLITSEQLKGTLERQRQAGGKFLETLLSMGYLTKEGLHEFLSKQPGVAAIDLARLQLDRGLMSLIPKQVALDNLVLPIDRLGKLLTVAMACPLDIATIREIEQNTGLRVKAVLCKLDDIHKAVNKYYPLDGGEGQEMAVFELPPSTAVSVKEDLSERIGQLAGLSVTPNTLIALEECAGDARCTLEDYAAVVASDPVLAAMLLRTANTAAYGVAGQVDNLWAAVALLGAEGVLSVAQAHSVPNAYAGVHIEPVVTRSRRCAKLASVLAGLDGRVGTGQAFTAGLLHQLGCFAMASVARDKYARVDLALPGQALSAAEKQLFTLSHPEAGARVGNRWRFPNVLCQVLGGYLSPGSATEAKELASMVCIASFAAGASGASLGEAFPEAWGTLHVDRAGAVAALQRALESF